MPSPSPVAEAARRRANARAIQWGMLFNGTATIDFDRLLNLPLHTGLEMLYALGTYKRVQRESEEAMRLKAEKEAEQYKREQARGGIADRMSQAVADAQQEVDF